MKLRSKLLVPLRAGCVALLFSVTGAVLAAQPNFVIILADDMGYSDAGCYGGEIQTPHLDGLARGGLRFTQFYNTARCWPSRACVLTGYYAQQVGRDALPGNGGGARGGRPGWARLLPEMLRPLGYRSYHSGKWHVDGGVLAGGFDRSYSLNDHDRYFSPRQHTLNDRQISPVQVRGGYAAGAGAADEGYYATTAVAEHAIEMLREHSSDHGKKPFFLYLAFTAPHFPLQALPQDIAVYKDRYREGWDALRAERHQRLRELGILDCAVAEMDRGVTAAWSLSESNLAAQIGLGECGRAVRWQDLTAEQKAFQPIKMAIHAAMVHRMDIEIGRVLAQLKGMGAFTNTVILFASDNGATAEQIIRGDRHDWTKSPGADGTFLALGPGWSSAANTPFRMHKSWVHEGGISTPLIVHWPAGIRSGGELRRTPGHLVDLPVTILELAGGDWPKRWQGAPLPKSPGRSLVPAFGKDQTIEREYLWWFHDGNRAVRVRDWKLVADHQEPWELYDLKWDRSERTNLAARHPERVQRLAAEWSRHMEEFKKDVGRVELEGSAGKGSGQGNK